jgi:hypothetical protein
VQVGAVAPAHSVGWWFKAPGVAQPANVPLRVVSVTVTVAPCVNVK